MSRSGVAFTLSAILGLSTGACVDERVVFRDRELFTEPPAAAMSFLGYTDSTTKLTVCGNCHAGQQGDWVQTAHGDAWVTLEASGSSQAFCEGCHTVNALGNAATGDAGYVAVAEPRYHDVQCESCHGPGLSHVQNPSETQPLAPLSVGLDLTEGCGECHNGTHHPFVEEWEQSGHGQVIESAAGREACYGCHTGENALDTWGIKWEYAEREEVLLGANAATEHLPIACGVCHDPHSNENDGQLRFAIDIPSEEDNLCMKCHHKRGNPDPTTFRGPHSPEGPVLLGYGGWWPPNMNFPTDTIEATHSSSRNPRLCAGCHVQRFEVTDAETGEFAFQATGHLFEAIPCLNASGIPTPGDCELTERTFRSCTGAGCHETEAIARNLYVTVENRIALLVETLGDLIEQVPDAQDPDDGVYTTAEGSQFNYELAANFAGSRIHNPILIEALLTASIQQMRTEYGLSVPSNVDLRNTFYLQRQGE